MSRVALHAFPDEMAQAVRMGQALGLAPGFVRVHVFPDGEILPVVPAVADTVIVYRSLDRPNVKLVELMLAHDAWRRAGAARLVLAAPYLGYMRQDAVTEPGAAVSQCAVGEFLAQRFDRVLTVDPHLHRTADLRLVLPGIETDRLTAGAAMEEWIGRLPPATVLVGPDAEARQWVEPVAARLGRDWRVLSKVRGGDRKVEVRMEGAPLDGRPALLVDDVCSTGGTLIEAARVLLREGAGRVQAVVTHALFDGETARRLREAGIDAVASTDSCPHPTNEIALAELLAGALRQEFRA